MRRRRHPDGRPLTMADVIAASSVHRGDCLIWTGPTHHGAPSMTYGGVQMPARRASYLVATGQEAAGRLRATCGERLCVAADHLVVPTEPERPVRPLWSYVAAPWDQPSGDGVCMGRHQATGVRCTLPAGPDELCIRHNRVAVQRERRRPETLANRSKGLPERLSEQLPAWRSELARVERQIADLDASTRLMTDGRLADMARLVCRREALLSDITRVENAS